MRRFPLDLLQRSRLNSDRLINNLRGVFEKSRFHHLSPTMFPPSSFQTAGANSGPRTVSLDLPGLFKHPLRRLVWIIAWPSLSSAADMGCNPGAQRSVRFGMRSDRVISAIGIAAEVGCALGQYPASIN